MGEAVETYFFRFGDETALIYDSPVTVTPLSFFFFLKRQKTLKKFTYKELRHQVETFAGALQNNLGIQKGDVVVIYMSMQAEAVITMLACTR
ncbi:AMP-binding protein [Patescibacteria group bacterium]|nr:AMP-binding protein [Patescibacteria group bacterium]